MKKPRTAVQDGVTRATLITELLEEMPNAGTLTLAKVAMVRWPTVFLDVQIARQAIAHRRGLHGAKSRKSLGNAVFHKRPGWQVEAMPESISRKRTPFVIKGTCKILVFGDLHIPYHDPQVIELMLTYAAKWKPDVILINGDLCDFYSCSRHEKDPTRPLLQELDASRQFLWWLRKRFPKQRIIYKIGNHETNLERYLVRAAPVLLGVPEFQIDQVMKLDQMNIELVDSLQLIKAGKLPIYHGHELPQGMSSPVNPARGIWMRVQETLLCNHWHRTSDHTESTGISKHIGTCWSVGCLCDLSPDYALVNKWNHGFALVTITDKNGDFEVQPMRIIKGKVF